MSNAPQGPGWWQASDGRWYPPNPQQHHEQRQPPPQIVYVPQAKQSSANWGCITAAILLPLAIVGGLVVLFVVGIAASSDDLTEPGGAGCEVVRYHLDGTAAMASVTMTNAEGNIEQVSDVAVPMLNAQGEQGVQIGCVSPIAVVSFTAQNLGETGDLSCRIIRDGVEVTSARSEGAFVVVSCLD